MTPTLGHPQVTLFCTCASQSSVEDSPETQTDFWKLLSFLNSSSLLYCRYWQASASFHTCLCLLLPADLLGSDWNLPQYAVVSYFSKQRIRTIWEFISWVSHLSRLVILLYLSSVTFVFSSDSWFSNLENENYNTDWFLSYFPVLIFQWVWNIEVISLQYNFCFPCLSGAKVFVKKHRYIFIMINHPKIQNQLI